MKKALEFPPIAEQCSYIVDFEGGSIGTINEPQLRECRLGVLQMLKFSSQQMTELKFSARQSRLMPSCW